MPDTSVNLATCRIVAKVVAMRYAALVLIFLVSFTLGYVAKDQHWFKTRKEITLPLTEVGYTTVTGMIESGDEIQYIVFTDSVIYIRYYD